MHNLGAQLRKWRHWLRLTAHGRRCGNSPSLVANRVAIVILFGLPSHLALEPLLFFLELLRERGHDAPPLLLELALSLLAKTLQMLRDFRHLLPPQVQDLLDPARGLVVPSLAVRIDATAPQRVLHILLEPPWVLVERGRDEIGEQGSLHRGAAGDDERRRSLVATTFCFAACSLGCEEHIFDYLQSDPIANVLHVSEDHVCVGLVAGKEPHHQEGCSGRTLFHGASDLEP
mmetsp:Transcript_106992/g.288150  ORF Transcript_106992/g.288150 Transcript_106992/m.288150 type:complete len:231 (-) Transcript_106992:668-1360(-)